MCSRQFNSVLAPIIIDQMQRRIKNGRNYPIIIFGFECV